MISTKALLHLHKIIISKALNNNESIPTIAKELGFTRRTIYQEIKHGTIKKMKTDLTTLEIYAATLNY